MRLVLILILGPGLATPATTNSPVVYNIPLDDPSLTSTFGEARGDHFHNGIDLISYKRNVKLSAPGKILFVWDEAWSGDELFGPGNFVIASHADGRRSQYYHLRKGTVRLPAGPPGGTNDRMIGRLGSSGHSLGEHLHFIIEENGVFLNPLNFLPAFPDKKKAIIGGLEITRKVRPFTVRRHTITISRGQVSFSIRAMDIRDGISYFSPIGLARLRFTYDGEVVRDFNFETLVQSDRGLLLGDIYDYDTVYKKRHQFNLGNHLLIRGTHTVHLEITEKGGRKHQINHRLIVK